MELIIRVLGISEPKHEIKILKFFIFPIDSMSELVYYTYIDKKINRLRRIKDMLTEEQKREFERIFNFYSLQKEYDSECRAEWSDKMWAFRTAVSILFYKFTFDKFEEKNGVEYSSYILEEIRN